MNGNQQRPRKADAVGPARSIWRLFRCEEAEPEQGFRERGSQRAYSMVEGTGFYEYSGHATIQSWGQKPRDGSVRAGNIE